MGEIEGLQLKFRFKKKHDMKILKGSVSNDCSICVISLILDKDSSGIIFLNSSGKVIKSYNFSGIIRDMASTDDCKKVVLLIDDSYIYAIDIEKGILWEHRETPIEGISLSSKSNILSARISNRVIVFRDLKPDIVSEDIRECKITNVKSFNSGYVFTDEDGEVCYRGKTKWNVKMNRPLSGLFVDDDGSQIIVIASDGIFSLNALGLLNWRAMWTDDTRVMEMIPSESSLLLMKDMLYFTQKDKILRKKYIKKITYIKKVKNESAYAICTGNDFLIYDINGNEILSMRFEKGASICDVNSCGVFLAGDDYIGMICLDEAILRFLKNKNDTVLSSAKYLWDEGYYLTTLIRYASLKDRGGKSMADEEIKKKAYQAAEKLHKTIQDLKDMNLSVDVLENTLTKARKMLDNNKVDDAVKLLTKAYTVATRMKEQYTTKEKKVEEVKKEMEEKPSTPTPIQESVAGEDTSPMAKPAPTVEIVKDELKVAEEAPTPAQQEVKTVTEEKKEPPEEVKVMIGGAFDYEVILKEINEKMGKIGSSFARASWKEGFDTIHAVMNDLKNMEHKIVLNLTEKLENDIKEVDDLGLGDAISSKAKELLTQAKMAVEGGEYSEALDFISGGHKEIHENLDKHVNELIANTYKLLKDAEEIGALVIKGKEYLIQARMAQRSKDTRKAVAFIDDAKKETEEAQKILVKDFMEDVTKKIEHVKRMGADVSEMDSQITTAKTAFEEGEISQAYELLKGIMENLSSLEKKFNEVVDTLFKADSMMTDAKIMGKDVSSIEEKLSRAVEMKKTKPDEALKIAKECIDRLKELS